MGVVEPRGIDEDHFYFTTFRSGGTDSDDTDFARTGLQTVSHSSIDTGNSADKLDTDREVRISTSSIRYVLNFCPIQLGPSV